MSWTSKRIVRRPILRGVALASMLLITAACGSSKSSSDQSTTSGSTPTSIPTTEAVSTTKSTPLSTSARPTCAEVDAMIATMSTTDRALLSKADFMYVGRGPSGGNTWRIYTQVDVTKARPTPEIAVYYDWSPASGLSDPVIVKSFDEREALVDVATLQTVTGMQCQQ